VGVRADPRRGAGDLLVAGEFDVVHRVVADLVAFGEDAAHHRLAAGHLGADLEEGRRHFLFAQHVEEAFGVFARAVVEAEGDDGAVAGTVGVEAGAAAGAADGADRAQAEDVGGFGFGRQLLGAAAPHFAAAAEQRPPAVALRREAGFARDEGEHQLLRFGALHGGDDGALGERLAGGVDDEQAGAALRLGAAEADAALVGAAGGGAEREAEVAGGGAASVGPRFELGERERGGGADREDELAAGLGELGAEQARAAWLGAGGGRRRGGAGGSRGGQRQARGERRGGEKDLAKRGDQPGRLDGCGRLVILGPRRGCPWARRPARGCLWGRMADRRTTTPGATPRFRLCS
jgi:hypothetical protein